MHYSRTYIITCYYYYFFERDIPHCFSISDYIVSNDDKIYICLLFGRCNCTHYSCSPSTRWITVKINRKLMSFCNLNSNLKTSFVHILAYDIGTLYSFIYFCDGKTSSKLIFLLSNKDSYIHLSIKAQQNSHATDILYFI